MIEETKEATVIRNEKFPSLQVPMNEKISPIRHRDHNLFSASKERSNMKSSVGRKSISDYSGKN